MGVKFGSFWWRRRHVWVIRDEGEMKKGSNLVGVTEIVVGIAKSALGKEEKVEKLNRREE